MQTEQITIAGHVFNVPVRYAEGHELTAGEASALNQTYHENLRNNFAKSVKEALEAGAFDQGSFQEKLDEYALSYQFGVRSGGGGRTTDPVMAEAMNIARGMIRAKLREQKRKNVDPKAINEAAKNLIAKRADIMELARQRVAEQQAAASEDLSDLVADLPTKAA